MPTQCISEQLRFEGFDGRRVEAAFDGGAVTSDAGALLLQETNRAIGLIDRLAACFRDGRDPGRVVHSLPTLIGQRIIGLALGYEDVNDHDDLRFDPVLALFADRLEEGTYSSINALAEAEKINRAYVCRLLNLTLLAPDIVEAILDGKHPTGLQLRALLGQLPSEWTEQRRNLDPS